MPDKAKGRSASPAVARVRLDTLDDLLLNNRRWAATVKATEPEYFSRLSMQQAPEVLWIGCSDSRVPANQILGLEPGQVFVHRNVGNQACHQDTNAMSCLEYAVDALQVKHVVVCGHHGCGAVKGALLLPARQAGLVNLWISAIRDIRNRQLNELEVLDPEDKWDRLAEMNVISQMYNVCTTPLMQAAWDRGQKISVHGLIYSLQNGLLKPVVPSVSGLTDLERLENVGMLGFDVPQTFNTCTWFDTETTPKNTTPSDSVIFGELPGGPEPRPNSYTTW